MWAPTDGPAQARRVQPVQQQQQQPVRLQQWALAGQWLAEHESAPTPGTGCSNAPSAPVEHRQQSPLARVAVVQLLEERPCLSSRNFYRQGLALEGEF